MRCWGNMFYFWGQGYHSTTDTARNPTWGEEAYVDAEFQKMTDKFVNQGIPVMIGEFGAMKRTALFRNRTLTCILLRGPIFISTSPIPPAATGLSPFFWDIPGRDKRSTGPRVRSTDPDNVTALTGGPALPPPAAACRRCLFPG